LNIDQNQNLWGKFYLEILEPHCTHKTDQKLGEMENLKDP